MRRDIEILKSLYLPEIEEMYSFAPDLKTSIQQDAFWDHFNSILFDAIKIADFFYSYKVAKLEYIKKNSVLIKDDNILDFIRFEQLKNEYISHLAADYCNGETNPTIELFLKIQFKPFIEEVTFQKEIKQAIIITEHYRLKRTLTLMDDAATFDITDNEITSAFQLLEKKKEYENLKEKMKEWDTTNNFTEKETSKTNKKENNKSSIRSQWKTIPLMFLKFAAAACITSGVSFLGYHIYKNSKSGEHIFYHSSSNTQTIHNTNIAPSSKEKINQIDSSKESNSISGGKTINLGIYFQGTVFNKSSMSPISNVLIKIIDEHGKLLNYPSQNGSFNIKLLSGHTYYITAFKNGYYTDKNNFQKIEVPTNEHSKVYPIAIYLEKAIGYYTPNDSMLSKKIIKSTASGIKNDSKSLFIKGKALDFFTNQTVQQVTIILTDESGNIETYNSVDGNFNFRILKTHNYSITGKKVGYFLDHTYLSDLSQMNSEDTIDHITIHVKKIN
jgi:hypothetical protein